MTKQGPILVALNFSQDYREILDFAEQEAERASANLLLLHVAGRQDVLRQRPPLLLSDPLEDCARAIKRIPKTRVNILMIEGEPIQGILSAAQSHKCTIIIMGRGGTPDHPGHVALAIQKKFPGKIHLIARAKCATKR